MNIPEIRIEDDSNIYFQNGDILCKKRNKYLCVSTDDRGYQNVTIKGKRIKLHRVLYEKFIGPIPKDMVVDHINNVRNDNGLNNLQLLLPKNNTRKHLKNINNSSGHKGIKKDKRNWRVSIRDNNISKNFISLHSALIYRKYTEFQLGYSQIFNKRYRSKEI